MGHSITKMITLVFFTGLCSTANAMDRVVTTLEDTNTQGTLRYEISQALPGDNIVFLPALSQQQIVLSSGNGPIQIYKSINILGDINGDGVPDISLSGDNRMSLFHVRTTSGDPVVFESLVITKGMDNYYGGCIRNYAKVPLILHNTTVSQCSARYDGGAIYNRGDLTIENSKIIDNTAGRGGGIVTFNGIQPKIINSELSGNSASRWGGAIYSYGGGKLYVEKSLISENYAKGAGAGVFLHGSAADFGMDMMDSTVNNNFCEGTDTTEDLEGVGGGVSAGGLGDVTITNSTFSNNSAGRDGGAISLRNSGLRVVRHSTIAYNKNDVGGLGPRNGGSNHPPGGDHVGGGIMTDDTSFLQLDHVLFAENGRVDIPVVGGVIDDVAGLVESGGFNLFQQSDIEYFSGPGNGDILGGKADLIPLAMNGGLTPTFGLGDCSQAIDAGDLVAQPGVGTVPYMDQRDSIRVSGDAIDIGAFERE